MSDFCSATQNVGVEISELTGGGSIPKNRQQSLVFGHHLSSSKFWWQTFSSTFSSLLHSSLLPVDPDAHRLLPVLSRFSGKDVKETEKPNLTTWELCLPCNLNNVPLRIGAKLSIFASWGEVVLLNWQVGEEQDHQRWGYSTVTHMEQPVYLAKWKDLNTKKRKEHTKNIEP